MDKVTVGEVLGKINEFAPFDTQAEFDNSGLIAGSSKAEISGIICTVDVTFKVIDEAIANNCNLIVAHHPILFSAYKCINDTNYSASVVLYALNNNINIIAAHTNVDLAEGGINDKLAELLNGKNITITEIDQYARIFDIEPCKLLTYANIVDKILDDKVKVIGSNDIIKRVIVIGGSGGTENIIKFAKENDILFMTAELKHHLAIMADDIGAKIIVFGHFTSERIFVTILSKMLKNAYRSLKILISDKNRNPYNNKEQQ